MAELPAITPTAVTNVFLTFPGDVSHLMPPMNEIPEEFKLGHTEWNKFASDMFFEGLENLQLHVVPGIDAATAWRHISAVVASFQPKHEHKEATVAYLSSIWFTKAETSKRTYA